MCCFIGSVGHDLRFEKAAEQLFGCEVHAFDPRYGNIYLLLVSPSYTSSVTSLGCSLNVMVTLQIVC